jgi:ribosomal protein S3AE
MAERRKYIEVECPFLDETIRVLGTPAELHNKTIKLDLTRKLHGKGLTIRLRILNIENKLYAIPNNLTLATSYIRRIMRKSTNYIEDSFQARCDDIIATFKPHLITRKKVSRAVRKNLRNTCREYIIEYAKTKTFNEIAERILNETLQKTMLPKLKKIYPLSFCDIRVFETKELQKIDINTIIIQKQEKIINTNENHPEEEIDALDVAENNPKIEKSKNDN